MKRRNMKIALMILKEEIAEAGKLVLREEYPGCDLDGVMVAVPRMSDGLRHRSRAPDVRYMTSRLQYPGWQVCYVTYPVPRM